MSGVERGLPPVLRLFAWAMATMAILSLLYTLAMTRLLHTPHPYGVTLFWGTSQGSDFTTFAERSHHFGTPAYWDDFNYPFTYPAPLAPIFALLFKLPNPLIDYLILCSAALAGWAAWLARELHAAIFVAVVLISSWPVLLLLNTANIEGLVAIILAAGVYAVLRDRFWLGATLIGLAAAMKLFPFILLALLFSRRRYREFAWGLAVAAITTLASLAALGPTILQAQHHIADGFRFIDQAFILSTQPDALNYSHSLFSLLKFTLVVIAHPSPALLNTTLRLYMAVAAIAGIALYFAVIRKLPILNQTLALTICAVLLPPLSADYTLVELLLPFGLLCLYAAETCRADLTPIFACFAVLFAWETFLTIRYSFDRPARTVALCALLIFVLCKPLPWQRLDQPGASA